MRMTLLRLTTAAAACSMTAAGLSLFSPAGAASASTPPEAEAPAAACATTPVFETAGYKDGQTLHMFDTFNAHVPAGYQAHPIRYQDGVFPTDSVALDQAVAAGRAKLDAAVQAFHSACPDAQIIIAGYSEGAVVAGDEIRALSTSDTIAHDQIHGVLYGDPKRPFGDGGIGGTAGGIETNLPTILPGVTMTGPQKFGDIAVHEICDENDGICNSTNMITNALAFANGLAGYAGLNGRNYHTSYTIDPVADRGSGLTLIPEKPIINYGPPLPLPIGTPWQLSQGNPSGARAAARSAMETVNSALPPAVKKQLAKMPWYQVANQS